MNKKLFLSLALMVFSKQALAHDGGHGPVLSDTGKYGGLVAAVVPKAESNKGAEAELLYKAELVRTEGMVRVYLYDKTMKLVDLKGFDPKAEFQMSAKVKGKWKNSTFPIELKDNHYQGKMPAPPAKPYNLDATFNKDGKALLSAFDNLD